MSFLIPKPKIPAPPNTPITANAAKDALSPINTASSLITGVAGGLQRKASTMKTSLIGGSQ